MAFVCGEALCLQNAQVWRPEEIKIYTPTKQQILLPDIASCLSVEAFLKMCHLEYDVVERKNAEAMSPSSRVPLIKCNKYIVSELLPLVKFFQEIGISLVEELDELQMVDLNAYISLVNYILSNAELYSTWVDTKIYKQSTKIKYSSVYPFPLSLLITNGKRNKERKRLVDLDWLNGRTQDVPSMVESCCAALSAKIEGRDYFIGGKPTHLDALVFGHTCAILNYPLPDPWMARVVQKFSPLVDHCRRIDRQFFGGQYCKDMVVDSPFAGENRVSPVVAEN